MNIQVGRLPVEPTAGLLEDRRYREGCCDNRAGLPLGGFGPAILNAPGVRD
jgi:hypothetical protein